MSEKVLNEARTAELWEATKKYVGVPTRPLAQAEYDALSEEEKRNGMLYMTPGTGENAPVPTGAVISFLALSAPHGYLVCDGSTYNITDYPTLAQYIQAQFGEANHFGGDGSTTFAVPDMRNLFLRGYHGDAEEQLSGEIGEKQEATEIPYTFLGTATSSEISLIAFSNQPGASNMLHNAENLKISNTRYSVKASKDIAGSNITSMYSARPVNMSVLYCIKT